MKKKILFALAIATSAYLGISTGHSRADSNILDFETYTIGTINNQDGWTSLGSAGLGCANYDHEVGSSLTFAGYGTKSLRISNAVTSGCFGDQTFAKPLINAVGETGATAGTYTIGTRQPHFEMQFDIASTVPGEQQPGLFLSISPDRGDGSRMSYLGFEDTEDGIEVIFYDVQGTSNPSNFVSTSIGTFDRSVPHKIKLTMDVNEGPSNDVVKVYVDGNLVHTGTSWENYYRFDSESSAEQSVRIVKTVLFRSGGTAAPSTLGKGYLIDNLSLLSGPIPTVPTPTQSPYAVPAQCSNIENLGAPIIGTNKSEKINGTSGNDLIFGLNGSDKIDGKGGSDCIVGGNGSDKLIGGLGNDVLLGEEGSDTLQGEEGSDKLYGGTGSDTLKGNDGDDLLDGGQGSDSANGGNNNDTCTAESKKQCEL